MRTRTRSGMWNRVTRGNQHQMPTSYTSLKYNNVWYYPPWTSLAEYHKTSRAIVYANATTYNDSETITDAGTTQREYDASIRAGRYNWNPVQHTKRKCGVCEFTAVSTRGTTRYVDGWVGRAPLPFSQLLAAPALTAGQMMTLYAECYNELIPTFESDVSLANFIMELKDFKGLMRHIPKATGRLMRTMYDRGYYKDIRWGSKRRGVPRNGKVKKEFNMCDTMSSLDLNYHYAIKPFFNDVVSIFDMWNGLEGAIKKLNAQGRVRNVRHSQRLANKYASLIGTNVGGVASYQYNLAKVRHNTYALTAEMKYRLRPTNRLDAFMAYSGLRLNPKKIWDALPFSFIVDQFCTVGEALGSFDSGEVDFEMTRLMESITSRTGAFEVLHPTNHAYSHQSVASIPGEADELLELAGYTGYVPVNWSMITSYERKWVVPIPYIRPPMLPRLQIPSLDAIRLDMDLMYQLFYKGRNTPSWRNG